METTAQKATVKAETIKERFIRQLIALKDSDTGSIAILRRNAGLSLAESRGALGLFYRLLPMQLSNRDEEIYFLVATLFPLNSKGFPGKDFGHSMEALRKARDSESLDRRMTILLDAEFETLGSGYIKPGELGFRLRQAVKLLASEEIGVDWLILLSDLLQWTHPEKWVQKKWARSYFGGSISDDN